MSQELPSIPLVRKRLQDSEKLIKSKHGERIIRLPISEADYLDLVSNRKTFMSQLIIYATMYPDIFPSDWESSDYGVHDIRKSKKTALSHVIIRHKKDRSLTYDIQPNFVLPHMAGFTKDVWFGVLLIAYGVPFWLVALGLGRDAMYWYRCFTSLGRFDLLGTTLLAPTALPQDLVMDEKITFWGKQEVYACMTVGNDCILGMGLADTETAVGLQAAYGKFKTAAQRLMPDYQALSINTDGWAATKKALRTLFPQAVFVLCFLHSVIKIRQVAQKEPQKHELFDKLWNIYRSETPQLFDNQVFELQNWASTNTEKQSVKEHIAKIVARKEEFKTAFDCPSAKRTTNMVDRLMKPIDRFLFMKQYFHGDYKNAELMLDALALVINFMPYAPRTKANHENLETQRGYSRAHDINHKYFDKNWLNNLLTHASCNGLRFSTK
jgi:hypothetical protein